MPDGQSQYIQLPDSSYAEFPSDMRDEDIAAAIKKNFPVTTGNSDAPVPEQEQEPWAVRTARGITQKASVPLHKFMRAAGDFAQGDQVAGNLGLANTALSVPGAAMSALDWLPGAGPAIQKGLSALAQPGVDAWNAAAPAIRGTMDKVWPNRPRLFSPEAGSQADELGQNMGGALSSTVAGSVAGEALGAVGKLRQPAANALSEGAYKVPPTVGARARGDIIETTQKYNVTPSGKGLGRLDAATDNLTNLQKTIEDNARTSGVAAVPTADVLASLDDVMERWGKGDTPDTFKAVIQRYRDQVASQQKPTLSMDDMISLKQNIQHQLRPLYNKAMKINPGLRETILEEAKDAVAKDLRSRLEAAIPEYADVNSELHKLIQTRPYVERAVNRISNYDLLNLRDAAAASAGAWAGGPVAAIGAAVAEKILTHPRVWSAVANKLSNAKPSTGMPPTVPVQQNGPEWLDHPAGFQYRQLEEP